MLVARAVLLFPVLLSVAMARVEVDLHFQAALAPRMVGQSGTLGMLLSTVTKLVSNFYSIYSSLFMN